MHLVGARGLLEEIREPSHETMDGGFISHMRGKIHGHYSEEYPRLSDQASSMSFRLWNLA